MAENDLKVIQKAKELATHTLKVTSNANRYPKKYRFSLVDKMQNKSMEIYEMLFEANRTDIKNYKRGDIVTRQEQEDQEQEQYLAEWSKKQKEKRKFWFRRDRK